MTASRPDWTQLNAYVDGELPPAEAAEVARAVAGDRGLAEAAAKLAKLKAAVHEGGHEGAHERAERPEIEIPAEPARRMPRGAIAACLLGVAVLAVAALSVPFGGPNPPPPWLTQAWVLHEDWARGQPAPTSAREANAGQVLTAVSRLGARAYLPDLTSAKLILSRIEPAPLAAPERAAMHLGYRGTRGCRVSLFILAGRAGLPPAFTRWGDGPRRSYAWTSPTHGYLLMADGMDEARLDLIARSLHRATRKQAPLDPETRTALRTSRDTSAPCPG